MPTKPVQANAVASAALPNDAKAVTQETMVNIKSEISIVNAYDLLDVLTTQECDPNNVSRRCHPLTGEYFNLRDVFPDSDALVDLKNQAKKAIESNVKKIIETSTATSTSLKITP